MEDPNAICIRNLKRKTNDYLEIENLIKTCKSNLKRVYRENHTEQDLRAPEN
jgi:hypothetical protein